MDTKCYNLGLTQGPDGLDNATLQDGPGRSMDTTTGELTHATRKEGSIALVKDNSIAAARPKNNKLHKGSKPTLRENHCDEEHSKACYGVSTGITEGDTAHKVEVLPPKTTDTEVDKFNSISGPKTKRFNLQVVNRVGFINRNKDTQGLCCPIVGEKSLPKHFGIKTEL